MYWSSILCKFLQKVMILLSFFCYAVWTLQELSEIYFIDILVPFHALQVLASSMSFSWMMKLNLSALWTLFILSLHFMLLSVSIKCIRSPWYFFLSWGLAFFLYPLHVPRLDILGMSAIMPKVDLAGPQQGQWQVLQKEPQQATDWTLWTSEPFQEQLQELCS